MEGHGQVRAVTPSHGPISGLGGIVFIEVTCALMRPELSPWAHPFLDYLVEPDTAIRVAFLDGTCNPVLQMENPKVFSAFSSAQLDAIQWDTLEEDISRCAHYDVVPDLTKLLAHLRRTIAKFQI
jgi:spermidine/putrescine transport system substrate-binding protein